MHACLIVGAYYVVASMLKECPKRLSRYRNHMGMNQLAGITSIKVFNRQQP